MFYFLLLESIEVVQAWLKALPDLKPLIAIRGLSEYGAYQPEF
jgi:hypothetical protein